MAKIKKPEKAKPGSQSNTGKVGSANSRVKSPENGTPVYKLWQKAAMAAIIAVAIFSVFSPSFNNLMVNMDDDGNVYQNPVIKSLSFKNMEVMFNPSTNTVGNYIPVTNLSFALDYYLYGLTKVNPGQADYRADYVADGYHRTAIIIHIVNTLLLFLLILELGGGNLWIAGFTALVWWGIHPMHVESVAWISARKDLMYVMFYFAGLLAYARYRPASGPGNYFWLLACLFLFILSLLSKAMASTFPLALLLIDFLKGRKPDWIMALEKLPFFALSFVFGFLAMKSQRVAGLIQTENVVNYYSYAERMMFSCYAILEYAVKMVVPYGFSALHPYPEKVDGAYPFIVYFSVLSVLALMGILFWAFYKNKNLAFGISFFIVGLLLILQFPVSVGRCVIAERYTYLSYAGLCYLIAVSANKSLEKYKGPGRTVTFAIMAIYGVWFARTTYERTMVWHDSKSLWHSIRQAYPDNDMAPTQLGILYRQEGQDDSAMIYLKEAADLCFNDPERNPWAYAEMGYVDSRHGRMRDAIRDFTIVINSPVTARNPLEMSGAFMRRGMVYLDIRQADSAISDFNYSLQLGCPDSLHIFEYRGSAFVMKNEPDMALRNLNRCLGSQLPQRDMYKVCINIGNAYIDKAAPDSAIAQYNRAIDINPRKPDAYTNRAITYYNYGHLAEAKADFKKVSLLGGTVDQKYNELLK